MCTNNLIRLDVFKPKTVKQPISDRIRPTSGPILCTCSQVARKPLEQANAKLARPTNHLPVALTAHLPSGCGLAVFARWLRRDRRLESRRRRLGSSPADILRHRETYEGILITEGSLLVAVLQMLSISLLCWHGQRISSTKGINGRSWHSFLFGTRMQEREGMWSELFVCMVED